MIWPVLSLTPFVALAALLGACLGSFYMVCIARYPLGQAPLGRSHCASCGQSLRPLQLIPVLSWLCLRGRCAHCRAPIGWACLVLELFSAGVAALLAARFGPGWTFAVLLLIAGALTVASGIDLECFILPDVITLPLAAAAPLAGVFVLGLSWQESLAGGLGAAGTLLALRWAFLRWRGVEALGLGDVKLMLSLGFLLGASSLPTLLLLASLCGLAASVFWLWRAAPEYALGQVPIPFGPFLSLGWLLTLVFSARF